MSDVHIAFQDKNATPIGIRTGMMTLLSLLRCSHYAGNAERSLDLPASPATGDTGLRAGIKVTKVTNPEMTKHAKTRKQKSGTMDAGELSSNYSSFIP